MIFMHVPQSWFVHMYKVRDFSFVVRRELYPQVFGENPCYEKKKRTSSPAVVPVRAANKQAPPAQCIRTHPASKTLCSTLVQSRESSMWWRYRRTQWNLPNLRSLPKYPMVPLPHPLRCSIHLQERSPSGNNRNGRYLSAFQTGRTIVAMQSHWTWDWLRTKEAYKITQLTTTLWSLASINYTLLKWRLEKQWRYAIRSDWLSSTSNSSSRKRIWDCWHRRQGKNKLESIVLLQRIVMKWGRETSYASRDTRRGNMNGGLLKFTQRNTPNLNNRRTETSVRRFPWECPEVRHH